MNSRDIDAIKVLDAQERVLRYQLQELSKQRCDLRFRCDHTFADGSSAIEQKHTLRCCTLCDSLIL